MATFAVFAIVLNALFLQKGPHPAPIFATKPLLPHDMVVAPPVRANPPNAAGDSGMQVRIQLIVNIQRELARKGFYDGPADGLWGAKTDISVPHYCPTRGIKISAESTP